MRLWKALEKDPEFHPPNNNITVSVGEQKRRLARQLARFDHKQFLLGGVGHPKLYNAKVCDSFY